MSPRAVVAAGLATSGLVAYHLLQKRMPVRANPAAVFLVMYSVGAILSLVLLATAFRPGGPLPVVLRETGWPSVAVAFAVLAIEIGSLLMYRYGWPVATGGLVVNVASALGLVAVGAVVFGERLDGWKVAGIACCMAGLALVSGR